MPRTLAVIATTAAVAVGAALIGAVIVTQRGGAAQFAQCGAGAVAGDLGGPFTLVNGAGQTVTSDELITEPTLIYFGYTQCPDVCPLDVHRNALAIDILEERGLQVQPAFISVDPARDTVEVVRDFAANMHPRMVGLTGTPEQVAQASRAYRTYYKAHPPVDGEYLVDHSSFSYLVAPEHGFLTFFRRDMSPQQLADQMGCFVEQI